MAAKKKKAKRPVPLQFHIDDAYRAKLEAVVAYERSSAPEPVTMTSMFRRMIDREYERIPARRKKVRGE